MKLRERPPAPVGATTFSVANDPPRGHYLNKLAERCPRESAALRWSGLSVAFALFSLERQINRCKPALARNTHSLLSHQVHHGLIVAERVFERILESLRVLRLVRLKLDKAQGVRTLFGDAVRVCI